MKKLQKILTPRVTTMLFVLAALLLGTSAIGGTRAAMIDESDTYRARIEMHQIGVSLQESGDGTNWTTVGRRDYVANSKDDWTTENAPLLGEEWQKLNGITEKEPVKLGQTYTEGLRVVNSGDINEYVRVSVYKYWYKMEGDQKVKLTNLDPDLIKLNFVTGNGWRISTIPGDNTAERTVLYYDPLLAANGGTSAPFTDTLTIDPDVQLKIKAYEVTEGNTIRTEYEYDGICFGIKAVVDAVQDHNADDAKLSSWGVIG